MESDRAVFLGRQAYDPYSLLPPFVICFYVRPWFNCGHRHRWIGNEQHLYGWQWSASYYSARLSCWLRVPRESHKQKEAMMYHKFSTFWHPSVVLLLFPASWLVCFNCFTFLICVLWSLWSPVRESCFWGKLLLCKRRPQTEPHGNLAAIPCNTCCMKSCLFPLEHDL